MKYTARPKAELCVNVDAIVLPPCARPKAELWEGKGTREVIGKG